MNNEKIERLAKEIRVKPGVIDESRILADAADALERITSARSLAARMSLWRTIMNSPITKLAAAAAIIVVAVVSISVLNRSVPAAFGIEQVIAASDNIRFLHVKKIWADRKEADEFWIKSDEQGRVVKARYYLPITEDGIKLIVWTPEKTEHWAKSKHRFFVYQTKQIEGWMQRILEQCQPKFVMQELLEEQKKGKVDIDIQKPTEKQKPALIVARYKAKPKIKKVIYYIDQATDLITRIEHYRNEDNHEVLDMTVEFSDYNVPIDEKMFSLRDEIPKDIIVYDEINQLCGVPQGNMSDEQAAAETVRQFFQALVDKDYKKAGLIQGGMLEEYAKEEFGRFNVTAIVSIGPPKPQPDWDEHGFKVPCELEIINSDGQKTIWKPGVYVRPGDNEMHPDRWEITGGIDMPTETESYLRLSNANSAKRFVITGWYDKKMRLQEEIKWLNEPNVLPDNEAYVKMSPDEVVKAFFETFSNQEFNEMQKFVPSSFVEPLKRDFEEAIKFGGKIQPPVFEVIGKPFWSAEHSAYFVKCRMREQGEIELESEGEQQQPRTDNENYEKMTPKEAAGAFFKACADENLDKFRKFWPRSAAEKAEQIKELFFGLKIISIGEPFKKDDYPGWFVPYEIKLKDATVHKNNLAVRNDNPLKCYIVDGGF
jgi:hypothetical protein